jgi:hypothetical protein
MVEIFGKYYFIDIDAVTESCRTSTRIKEDGENEPVEINIFKYELLKICVERLLNEYDPSEDEIDEFIQKDVSISFKIAFNTLIKNNTLIEDETYE